MSDNNKSEPVDTDTFLFLSFALVVVAAVAWYYLNDKYAIFWLVVKAPIINALYHFSQVAGENLSNAIFFWVDGGNFYGKASFLYEQLWKPNFSNIQNVEEIVAIFDGREEILKTANVFIRQSIYPFLFCIFAYVWHRIFSVVRHNNVHTIDSLARQESELFPSIKVVLWDNPAHEKNLQDGSWAMDRKSYEYAKERGCLNFGKDEEDNETFSLNEEKIFLVLRGHLGKRLKSIDDLNDFEKRLFIIFSAKIVDGSSVAELLIDTFAREFTSESFFAKNLSFGERVSTLKTLKKRIKEKKYADKMVAKYFVKYKKNPKILEISSRHAFVTTFIAGLLNESRNTGVMAASYFLWLKKKDRRLWFLLDNVGRKTSFVESSGAWSHFQLEVAVGKAIAIPYVRPAIKGFDEYFFQHYENYITENDYEEI